MDISRVKQLIWAADTVEKMATNVAILPTSPLTERELERLFRFAGWSKREAVIEVAREKERERRT
jgi:hypothetical protein